MNCVCCYLGICCYLGVCSTYPAIAGFPTQQDAKRDVIFCLFYSIYCRGVWYTPDCELHLLLLGRLLLFGHLLLFGRLQNAPTQRDAKRDVIFCPFYSIYCRGVWYTPYYEWTLLLFVCLLLLGRLQNAPTQRDCPSSFVIRLSSLSFRPFSFVVKAGIEQYFFLVQVF